MKTTGLRFLAALCFLAMIFLPDVHADDASTDSGNLLALSDKTDVSSLVDLENNAKAALDHSSKNLGLKIDFAPSTSYPGVGFKQPAGGRDLSKYHAVETDVTNVGQRPVNVALRVDNEADWTKKAWNSENVMIAPGETKTVHVTFGISFGQPGYALDPAHVSYISVFAIAPEAAGSIVVKALRAGY